MPQDGIETFSSFLAGVFLTRKKIDNLEFFELLDEFEREYNVTIVDSQDLIIPVYFNDNSMLIKLDYDDIITNNGKKMTVREYLLSLTSLNVRLFFAINFDSINSNEMDNTHYFSRILSIIPRKHVNKKVIL